MPTGTTDRVPFTIPLTGEERWHIIRERSRILRAALHGRQIIDWIEEGHIAEAAYRQTWPRHATVPVADTGMARIASAIARA